MGLQFKKKRYSIPNQSVCVNTCKKAYVTDYRKEDVMKLHMNESNAKAVGMYDPRFEHDNCGIGAVVNIKGVKTLKLDIPLVPENRINWAFVPLHIAKIYILKLCLDEEIIPRCRFPCSRGYHNKYINWQKKQ